MSPSHRMTATQTEKTKGLRGQSGQALVETVIALPVLILLFAGCVQFVQIGIAHAVVRQAAFEGGREAYIRGHDLHAGARVAEALCRAVSPGRTTFTFSGQAYRVTHELQALFPVVRSVTIDHACSIFAFQAGEAPAP